jgi:hypothetical protein
MRAKIVGRIIGIIGAVLAGSNCVADTVTYQAPFTLMLGENFGGPTTVDIPHFDQTLGTLTSLEASATMTVEYSGSLYNPTYFNDGTATASLVYSPILELGIGGYGTQSPRNDISVGSFTVDEGQTQPFDSGPVELSIPTYQLTSAQAGLNTLEYSSITVNYVGPFYGLPFDNTGSAPLISSDNADATFDGEATVTYDYIPAPEPTTASIIFIALFSALSRRPVWKRETGTGAI